MNKRIAGLLLLSILLAGCVAHSGKPSGMPQPPSVTTHYSVQNNVTYTPQDWPQQLNAEVYVWPDCLPYRADPAYRLLRPGSMGFVEIKIAAPGGKAHGRKTLSRLEGGVLR